MTKILILIILITFLGGFLRFYKNTINPASLNIDEVAYGYSAYSILKTGKDEHGKFMPLAFESTGDYKNPLLIYSLVPSIALFGLNEFSVRFTTALAGMLSIPAFFFLIKTLLRKTSIALIGSILLAVSPWHIFYSRYASESLLGSFFLILGVTFFVKMFEGRKIWAVGAALAFVLATYTYHSYRYFLPLFLPCLIFSKIKFLKAQRLNVFFFIILMTLMLLPLAYLVLFGPANTRANMIFLSVDIDYTRYVILDHLNKFGENFLLFFFWVKRFLNYFQPDFLFFNGLNMTLPGTFGLGVLYLFELPLLVLGIIRIIKDNIPYKYIILSWILLGILPASLTNNEQSTVRSLLILPPLLIIVAVGAVYFIRLMSPIKNSYFKAGLILSYSAFFVIFSVHAFLVFSVHFPLQRGEAFMEGTKETVEYALANKDKYTEVVFDPVRGIEAPYIVSIPHMYVLFYSQYDPAAYQREKIKGMEGTFDKFTVRNIDWRVDRNKKAVLLIGSPWSLPENEMKEGELLKKIYLANGILAFLIVSPL